MQAHPTDAGRIRKRLIPLELSLRFFRINRLEG